jgi:predicted sugar kinase
MRSRLFGDHVHQGWHGIHAKVSEQSRVAEEDDEYVCSSVGPWVYGFTAEERTAERAFR